MIHATAQVLSPNYIKGLQDVLRGVKNLIKKSGFERTDLFDCYNNNAFGHPVTGEPVKMHYFAARHEDENGKVIKKTGVIFGYDAQKNVYELTAEDFNTLENHSVLYQLDRDIHRDIKDSQEGDPGDRDEWLADQYEREAVDREMYG